MTLNKQAPRRSHWLLKSLVIAAITGAFTVVTTIAGILYQQALQQERELIALQEFLLVDLRTRSRLSNEYRESVPNSPEQLEAIEKIISHGDLLEKKKDELCVKLPAYREIFAEGNWPSEKQQWRKQAALIKINLIEFGEYKRLSKQLSEQLEQGLVSSGVQEHIAALNKLHSMAAELEERYKAQGAIELSAACSRLKECHKGEIAEVIAHKAWETKHKAWETKHKALMEEYAALPRDPLTQIAFYLGLASKSGWVSDEISFALNGGNFRRKGQLKLAFKVDKAKTSGEVTVAILENGMTIATADGSFEVIFKEPGVALKINIESRTGDFPIALAAPTEGFVMSGGVIRGRSFSCQLDPAKPTSFKNAK